MSSSRSPLNPLDLYNLAAELSDEERMVKESVARYVDEQAIPVMREAFEQHRFPRGLALLHR
jgi:glutaryl-CoA dehydrogenase